MSASRDFDRGTAGASARREHERRKAARERRVRERHPVIGGLVVALAEEPQDEVRWRRGGEGEQHVAVWLERRCRDGVQFLHDRRIPGSRANIDHVAIAPSGVWVIDTKRYSGRVRVKRPLLGSPRLVINGRDESRLTEGLGRQVDAVGKLVQEHRPDVSVHGVLCFVDTELPMLGLVTFDGYPLLYRRALAKRLNASGPLDASATRDLAAALAERLRPA